MYLNRKYIIWYHLPRFATGIPFKSDQLTLLTPMQFRQHYSNVFNWATFDNQCLQWGQLMLQIITPGTALRHINRHDDVIKWNHFPRYWFFVRGIHRWPVNSPLKGQWGAALIFSLICARMNGWVTNSETGDLRHHCAHYDVTVIKGNERLYQHLQWNGNSSGFDGFFVVSLKKLLN